MKTPKLLAKLLSAPILIVALMGMTSCVKTPFHNSEYDGLIKLAPTVKSHTKYDGNVFAANDEISLFVTQFVNDQPSVIKPSGNFVDNTKFVRDNLYFTSETNVGYPINNAKIDVYAVYPYKADFGDNMTAVPFNLAIDQTTQAKVLEQDILISTLAAQIPSAAPLPLVFDHAMAKVIVKATSTAEEASDIIKVAKIVLRLADGTTVDFTTKDGSANKPSVKVVNTTAIESTANFNPFVTEKFDASTGYGVQAEAIVIPQTIAADVDFVQVIMSDESSFYYAPNDGNGVPITLNRGTINYIDIKVNYAASQPITGTVTISDWATGAVIPPQTIEGAKRTHFEGTTTVNNITKVLITCKHNSSDDEQTTYTVPVYYDVVDGVTIMKFDFKGLNNAPGTENAVITQVRFDNGSSVTKVFDGEKPITLNDQTPPTFKFRFDGTTLTWVSDFILTPSNCYLTVPGKTIMFNAKLIGKTTDINAYNPGNYGSTVTNGGVTSVQVATKSVKVKWQTAHGRVESGANPTMLITEPLNFNEQTGFCSVKINDAPSASAAGGSAYICAYDGSNQILWSWHIWVVNDVIKHIDANNYTMMDRALGAISAKSNASINTFGMMYQWGRKDPFTPSMKPVTGLTSGGEEIQIYSDNGTPITKGTKGMNGAEFTATSNLAGENPNTYFIKNPSAYYSPSSTNDQHFGFEGWNPNIKTMYDPCPTGYRIPAKGAYNGRPNLWSISGSNLSAGATWYGSWFPASGYRISTTGEFYQVGEYGAYAMSTPQANNRFYYTLIVKSINRVLVNRSTGTRTNACTTRCVKI